MDRNKRQICIIQKIASKYWNNELINTNDAFFDILIIHQTPSKIVCVLPQHNDHPQVFCKAYFKGEGFLNETNGFRAANSIRSIGNISVTEILEIYPEFHAIITEFISLKDSRNIFRKIKINRQKINWKDIGSWLRNFHDSSTTFRNNGAFIAEKITKSKDQLNYLSPQLSSTQVRLILNLIDSAENHFMSNPIEWVFSHGDFNIGNIKYSQNKTFIIDFENTKMTPRGYEVIYFLSCLESSVYFIFRKRLFQWLIREFINGYDMKFVKNSLNEYIYLIGKFDMIAFYNKRRINSKQRKQIMKTFYFLFEKKVIKDLQHWLSYRENMTPTYERTTLREYF